MDIPNWNGFSAFGGMLNGPEVYDAWTIDNVLAFLKEVSDCPTMYGITGTDHVEGVHCLYHSFVAKPTQHAKNPIEVTCHGARQLIRDFDSVIAYIFSVQAVMEPDATSAKDFIPSLLVFSKFLKMLTQKVTGQPPVTTCLVLAQHVGADGVVGFFGSSFRKTAHKAELALFRRKQLVDGFDPIFLETDGTNRPDYGYCAESTPLLSNLAMQKDGKPEFTSAIEGFAMDLLKAARLPSLDWEVFCRDSPYKEACVYCQNLLTYGGRDPVSYNCFPHDLVDHTNAQTEP